MMCRLDDGSPCELAIWDTSGQEKYNSLTSAFLRNALGAVIVYDITNKQVRGQGQRREWWS